jgi:gas vesicle protein
MMSDDCRGSGTVLLSFLVGAAVGGGLALLMAPRSGEETREQLREAGDEARERMRDVLGDAEEKLREPLEEIQNLLQEKKEVFLAAVEAGKQAAKEQGEKKEQGST